MATILPNIRLTTMCSQASNTWFLVVNTIHQTTFIGTCSQPYRQHRCQPCRPHHCPRRHHHRCHHTRQHLAFAKRPPITHFSHQATVAPLHSHLHCTIWSTATTAHVAPIKSLQVIRFNLPISWLLKTNRIRLIASMRCKTLISVQNVDFLLGLTALSYLFSFFE